MAGRSRGTQAARDSVQLGQYNSLDPFQSRVPIEIGQSSRPSGIDFSGFDFKRDGKSIAEALLAGADRRSQLTPNAQWQDPVPQAPQFRESNFSGYKAPGFWESLAGGGKAVGEMYESLPDNDFAKGFLEDDPYADVIGAGIDADEQTRGGNEWDFAKQMGKNAWDKVSGRSAAELAGTAAATFPLIGGTKRLLKGAKAAKVAGEAAEVARPLRRVVGDAVAHMKNKIGGGSFAPKALGQVEDALMHVGSPELERAMQHGGTDDWRSIQDAILNDSTGRRTRNVGNLVDNAGGRVSSEMDSTLSLGLPDLSPPQLPPTPPGTSGLDPAWAQADDLMRRRGMEETDIGIIHDHIGTDTAREIANASDLPPGGEQNLIAEMQRRIGNGELAAPRPFGPVPVAAPGGPVPPRARRPPAAAPAPPNPPVGGAARARQVLDRQVDFLRQQGMGTTDAEMLIAQQGTPGAVPPPPLPAGMPQTPGAPPAPPLGVPARPRQAQVAIDFLRANGVDTDQAERMVMAQIQQPGVQGARQARQAAQVIAPSLHIPTAAEAQTFGGIPNTSTRVEEARRALEARGIGTETARRAVPRRGTRAAEFQRGVESLNPIAAELPPGQIPTIDELLGEAWTDKGRSGLIGHSPKRLLETASGKRVMHKGQPFFGLGSNTADDAASIRRSALGHEKTIATEESGSRIARLANERTPIAHEVQEGGSVQRLVEDRTDLPTLASLRQLTPAQIQQLALEEPVDVMLRNSDNHGYQFFIDSKGDVIPADKGGAHFDKAIPTDARGVSSIGHPSKVHRQFYKSGPYKGQVDPNKIQEFLQQKMIGGTSEKQYRDAMTPWFKRQGWSDADADTFMRQWMSDVHGLPQLFGEHYRRNVIP